MNTVDRRRATLATAFTIVALPALWIAGRNDNPGPAVGSANVPGPEQQATPTAESYLPDAPVFVPDSSGADGSGSTEVIMTAPPANPNTVEARASYKRYGDAAGRPCTTTLAPFGVTITVTNTDNGKSTTCLNSNSTVVPTDAQVVLHTDVFVAIGDLIDSPIPVRLTW